MLCEHCNEREATVHLTQVLEGEVKKLHLCEECAAQSGFDVHGTMSVTDSLPVPLWTRISIVLSAPGFKTEAGSTSWRV